MACDGEKWNVSADGKWHRLVEIVPCPHCGNTDFYKGMGPISDKCEVCEHPNPNESQKGILEKVCSACGEPDFKEH